MNKPEILAPAGGMDAFLAGLKAGAGAIYLGEEDFSARAHAQNFSMEEIKRAVDLAHSRGVKVHVTLNTLLSDEELERASQKAVDLAKIGVDAFIVQDLGLVRVLRSILPYMDLHGSTQMTIHNVQGAKLLKDLGFSRVVLSRETPYEEIKRIKDQVDIEVEAFVHGALCVCYSGQCTMSSYIGGRSGNRGDCAQPCRKQYELLNQEGQTLYQGYALSPKDLWSLDHIEDLVDLGIDSFKIEGRMKKPAYVYYVTKAFKEALEGKRDKGLEEKAKASFNRGFTKGRTFGAFGRDFITKDHGKNKGVKVGHVLPHGQVHLDQTLEEGDGLAYIDQGGDSRGFELNAFYPKGETSLPFPYKPKANTHLYRTSRGKKGNKIDLDLDQLPLRSRLIIQKDQAIKFKILSPKEVEVTGPIPDLAKKAGLGEDRVLDQMKKMGDSPFYLEELDLHLDPGLFLPVKTLNALRRKGLEALLEQMSPTRKKIEKGSYPDLVHQDQVKGKVSLYLENVKVYQNLGEKSLAKIDRIFTRDLDVISDLQDLSIPIYYSLPPIVTGPQGNLEIQRVKDLYKQGKIQGLETDTLWALAYRKELEGLKFHGGPGLNIFNCQAIAQARDLGLDSMDLSYEATYTQALTMAQTMGGDLTTLYYGFLRSMIMDHCPNSLIKGCGEDRKCKTCPLSGTFFLKDQLAMAFPYRRKEDKTWIYNARPLYLGTKKKTYQDGGINLKLAYQFEGEPMDEIINSLDESDTQVKDLLKKSYQGWTYGHYKRGILGEEIYE